MTLNASKCHLLAAGYKDELILASVEDALLWEDQSSLKKLPIATVMK